MTKNKIQIGKKSARKKSPLGVTTTVIIHVQPYPFTGWGNGIGPGPLANEGEEKVESGKALNHAPSLLREREREREKGGLGRWLYSYTCFFEPD
jgi:hypothetical protein